VIKVATTKLLRITVSPNKAIDYVTADKVVRLTDNHGVEHSFMFATLSAYQNCQRDTAKETFARYAEDGRGKFQQARFGKDDKEIVAWHFYQNFAESLPAPVANEIGRRLASEMFGGHACVISTHTNTANTHNHFIVTAWDNDGRKPLNKKVVYRKLREASDRLCEEYGLSVLHATRKFRLVAYRDKEGTLRYYEPTARKSMIMRKCRQVDSSTAVADFGSKEQALTSHETTRRDIDALLPSVKSYNELLVRLRDMGYAINAKKANGGWLKHVSFQAPGHTKATRDKALCEDGFYTRENLAAFIEQGSSRPQGDTGENREPSPDSANAAGHHAKTNAAPDWARRRRARNKLER
jgi:hypothetical protein